MAWNEYVHVEIRHFVAGELPWVVGEEVGGVYDDSIWQGNPYNMDTDGCLKADVIRLILTPLAIGKGESLLQYEVRRNGYQETFSAWIPDLMELCGAHLGSNDYVALLTRWECDAGKEPSTPDSPGEYFADWQPMGVVDLDAVALGRVEVRG